MPTNFDTPLSSPSSPLDLAALLGPGVDPNAPAIEIEIENPDAVTLGVGGVEFDLTPKAPTSIEDAPFDANLAEFLDDKQLQTLSSELLEQVESDINARKDWVEMYVKGLEVLGMKYEERTEPWIGSCGVYSPLLLEAAVRFQSETITETFPAQGPVKTQIIGEADDDKEDAASRVGDDMNYWLTEKMIDYRSEHERLLFSLGLIGAAFKKVYPDLASERPAAVFIPAEDMILPYGASNVYTAERVAHVMRKTKNDVKKLQVAGFYRDTDLGDPVRFFSDIEKKKAEDQGYSLTEDERYQIYEVHADWDFEEDKDGIALPYIVTIEKGTSTILAIRRNWREDDARKLKRQHFVQYTYVPGFGAYGYGFIHLIGGYARAGTSVIRQLVDAGTLSNLPGGLKAKGLRIKGDDTPISPGEFRDVDIPGGTVRDNIMTLPYKEPSQVLAALLDRVTEDGRRLASIADLKVSDMSAQAPVGTTLAILERQLKIMGAVQARVHESLKIEFRLLKEVIKDFTPEYYSYIPAGGDPKAKRSDYDVVDIIPVSDPNAATMAQRIMQYQAAMQMAQGAPQIYDLPELHREMLETLGIKNTDKLIPASEDAQPRDPVSENMGLLTGKPAKAFIYQDHKAHIATHQAMMKDPTIMAMMGQTPMAQQVMGAMMAHIMEHVAFDYRTQIEEQLGTQLTAPDQALDPGTELQLSRVVAQAGQQLLQVNAQKAQAQQAQAAQQHPEIQMKQAELQLKAQELQRKEADSRRDFQIAQAKLQLEQQRMVLDAQRKQGEDPRLKAAQISQTMMHKEQAHRQKLNQQAQQGAMKRQQAQQAAQQAAQLAQLKMAQATQPAPQPPQE